MCIIMLIAEFHMSKAASVCLFSLGPDCCSLATCDSSDLTLLFTRRLVRVLTTSPELLSFLPSTKPPYLDQLKVSESLYILSNTIFSLHLNFAIFLCKKFAAFYNLAVFLVAYQITAVTLVVMGS